MTQEEKARAYDEALERLKPLYEQAKKDGNPIWSTYEYLVPELAESEDERIRKALVWHLKADVDFVSNGVTKAECLAYLEKQKEHVLVEPELKTPDWVHGNWDDEYMINTVIGRYSLHAEVARKRGDTHDYNLSKSMESWLRSVVKPLIVEKQKEQKPDSITKYVYSKEDKKFIQDCANILVANDCVASAERLLSMFEQKPIDYEAELKKCKDNPLYFYDKYVSIKQKPVEWSEEDKETLKDIISGLKAQKLLIFAHENQGKAQMNARIDWLQSLPERFNLQPQQEWSEEDERMFSRCIKSIETSKQFADSGTLKAAKDKEIAWLKSLHPQYHGDVTMTEAYKMGKEAGKASSWKPSEEQMKALNALNCHGSLSYVGQQNQLISLYNDLKKLM